MRFYKSHIRNLKSNALLIIEQMYFLKKPLCTKEQGFISCNASEELLTVRVIT